MALTPEEEAELAELESRMAPAPQPVSALTPEEEAELAQLEARDGGVEKVDVDELYRQAGGVERKPYITEVPFPEQAERKKKLYDEDLSFVQNVDRLAFDIGNQFNNSLTNMAGAPLNLIGAGMAKIRSKITGDEYVSPDYQEGLRKTMDLLPGVTVLDEEPRTPLGYVGQTGAEAATFLIPQIKVAQVLAAGGKGAKALRGTQALAAARLGSKGVKLLRETSEQFLNEAAQNTGRFLAIETGMAVGAGAGRAVGDIYDLSPGGRFAVELLSGIAGGFGGAGAAKIPSTLLKKTEGKTATEVLEMVSDGTIEYKELQWMPMMKEAVEPTPAPKNRVSSKEFVATLSDKPKTLDAGMGQKVYNYTTKDGVDISIKEAGDSDTLLELNGKQVQGDITLDVIAVKGGRGEGKASKELDRVLAEADSRDMSVDLDIDPANATLKGEEKGLSASELKEWYQRKGFIFNENGKSGYRPRKSEDANQFIAEKVKINQTQADDITKKLNEDDFYSFSDLDSLLEAHDTGKLKQGYYDGGDNSLYYYDGLNRPKKVDNAEIPFDYDTGKYKVEIKPTPAPKTPEVAMPGIVKETVEFNAARADIADKLVQRRAAETANASKRIETYKTSTNPIMRATINLISALSPSTIAGKDIVFDIDDARNMIRAAEKVGSIVRRKAQKFIKKDPTAENKINAFLDGEDLDPSLEPIRAELEKFRDTLVPLQKLLVENLDDEVIASLPKETREELISTIRNSINEKSYVSREYRMFTDKKYKPSPAQRKKAEQEIATDIMMSSEAGTMTMDRALELAKRQLDDLESKSARVRLAKPGGYVPNASDGVLKSKRNIGPEERKYLGEIVEPGERVFGTLSRVSRLVAAQNQDIAITNIMLETGLARRNRTTPTQVEVPLASVKGASGIYAEPEIVSAVTRLRMGDTVEKSNQPVARVLGELYNSLVGFSKATKVVLSPIAYPVQVYGNVAAALSSGIMPTGNLVRGIKLAMSEFGYVRDALSGKNAATSKALLDDIEKMAKYGLNTQGVLASDIRDSFKRSLSQKTSDFLLDVPSKFYSVADVAFRYVVWKGNQKQLRKMFPNATQEQIESAAARLTNDTYQQYDKVSGVVKYLSRVGLANPFVTFTAEKLRNMYNQGRYAAKMLNGTFGRDIGLDPSTADIAAMQLQGGKRAASLAAVAGGSAYVFNEINKYEGLDMEAQKGFGETIAPNWDSKKQLVIIPDASGRKGVYFNPSYLVPELTGTNAFYAGLRNKDLGSVFEYLTEELMGEGTFVFQAGAKIILGFDENGKKVSLSADKLQQHKDKAKVFWEDVLEPGGMREIDKWERALQDVGDVDEQQLLMRLMGFRYNTWDAERSGKLKMRYANNAMRDASGEFSSARDYKDLTPNQLESVYEEMNAARRSQFDVIRGHYQNLGGGTWKYTEDERIQMMKDAGMSGSDILDVIDGTYTDMPRTKKLRTSEIYDEIPGTTTKEKLDAMNGIRKADPGLFKRLVQHHKRLKSIESRNLSSREKLILGLDVDKRVDYLLSVGADKNRALMREYQRKGIATKSVLEAIAIKQRGY